MEKNGRSPENDVNYLMAKKLANHPEFEAAVSLVQAVKRGQVD